MEADKNKDMERRIKRIVSEFMDGMAFLPIHNKNKEIIERVKKVWRGKNIYKDPKII